MAAAQAEIVLLEKFEGRKCLKTIQDDRCNVLLDATPLMVFLPENGEDILNVNIYYVIS